MSTVTLRPSPSANHLVHRVLSSPVRPRCPPSRRIAYDHAVLTPYARGLMQVSSARVCWPSAGGTHAPMPAFHAHSQCALAAHHVPGSIADTIFSLLTRDMRELCSASYARRRSSRCRCLLTASQTPPDPTLRARSGRLLVLAMSFILLCCVHHGARFCAENVCYAAPNAARSSNRFQRTCYDAHTSLDAMLTLGAARRVRRGLRHSTSDNIRSTAPRTAHPHAPHVSPWLTDTL